MSVQAPLAPMGASDVEPLTAPAGARTAGRRRHWSNVVGPLVGIVLFVGLWWYMHEWGLNTFFDKPDHLLPSPATVVDASYVNAVARGEMLDALGWTTLVALTGLSISILVGTTLAVVMAQATWIEKTFWPYLIAAQAIPILAIVPLIGIIFGFGIGSRLLVCVIISIFPIVSNTLFGLLSADAGQHDLFSLRRASRWTRLRKLQFPSALPAIFTGYRIAAGLAVIGAVVGELFFRQGGKGLGILMDRARSRNLYQLTYGALILSSFLGIAVFVFFGWLSKLVVGRWYESTRKSGS